ncbi:hypothetical protein F5148DRAFT_1154921 [Russula earlei]|uniref:Uncharacterized protein n=1 Tax=Russula earlei TaxID=71964 RepID=A0ACC0TRD7_9AGAM|nr:hypothetical protein F5148DRAFT_1154921 [Russula earlei]
MINPATVTAVPRPSSCTSPAPHDRDDIVELDSVDTTAKTARRSRIRIERMSWRTFNVRAHGSMTTVIRPSWYGDAQEQSMQHDICTAETFEHSGEGRPATLPPESTKSTAKSRPTANRMNAKASVRNAMEANGVAVTKSASSAAIVDTVHMHSYSQLSHYGCEGLKNRVTLFKINKGLRNAEFELSYYECR